MSYPPKWRRNDEVTAASNLMREHPFAHMITTHSGVHSTRVPFIVDHEENSPVRMRAHVNAQNPQVSGLDGAQVLVVFSGCSTYVSPNWRTNLDRAATFDYEEVQVRGKARVVKGDIAWFRQLVDDLARSIEPQYSGMGDYPVWQSSMAPDGYIESLYLAITAFEIEIEEVRMISKLHQSFLEVDRRSIADHLKRSDKEDARSIAQKIIKSLDHDKS